MVTYNINFVPELKDRKVITPYRQKYSKIIKSNKSLQFPVHMALISGGFETDNIKEVELHLKKLCQKQDPITIISNSKMEYLTDKEWVGLNFKETKELRNLRTNLQKIRNTFAKEKQVHFYKQPHITFAFKKDVSKIKEINSPVKSLEIKRITICKRVNENKKYKIYKHFNFKD